MPFKGVYKAVFSYTATNDQELTLKENDILYLIETADDGWWTVKKRVVGAASEEPEGIVPHNYIEPAKVEGHASALYQYERQNDEELSFKEGQQFDVYATEGDWVLVGANNQFGFVPSNYIGESTPSAPVHPQDNGSAISPGVVPVSSQPMASGDRSAGSGRGPALETQRSPSPEYAPPKPARPTDRNKDLPSLPQGSPKSRSSSARSSRAELTFPVMDVVGRHKVPKTLVVAQQHVTLINDDGGGRTQRWDVPDILRYSSEKKYVFLDLVNPKASLQLRVNSTNEASQIVTSLGQIVGAGRAGGGLQEVLNAADSAGKRTGIILVDFEAANNKELSVDEGEEITILSTSNKDWWLVRNADNKEGLVPKKFVHVEREENKLSGLFRGKKQREKQFEKDQTSAKEEARNLERNRGLERSRSTRSGSNGINRSSSKSKSLPDPRKLRLWIDRTGTFKVDAQLLGCSDGKVHLHKSNGVKIAVPAAKLSIPDIEYVESVTGINLSDDKPLRRSDSKYGSRRSTSNTSSKPSSRPQSPTDERHEFWLSFFLDCGVDPQNANRYAKNFSRDNMDESTLEDTNASVLRTLGLREGDILRVTKRINEKLGRVQKPEGGLYSNEGVLKNNTGATPKAVENEVWSPTSQTVAPSMVPLQPQLTQSVNPSASATVKPQDTQSTQPAPIQPAPTGALADLLGMTSISQPAPAQKAVAQPAPLQPNLTQSSSLVQPLQQQPTAAQIQEAEIANKQRQTQQQILQMQAQLQKEQIKLLQQQQEQLRKQQDELLQIQKTGSQLQALGPFATGNAQRSTFPVQASSVLAAPAPPQSRPYNPAISTAPLGVQPTTTGPFSGIQPTTTGPFSGVQPTTTGPFSGIQPTTTGPFSGVQPTTTGPFSGIQPTTTGPFSGVQPTTTGPFSGVQPTTTGPFSGVQPTTTGPFSGIQPTTTGPFSGIQPTTTGPFSGVQPTTTGPFSGVQPTTTGPFSGVQPTTTGPFAGLQNLQTQQSTNFAASQPPTSFQNNGLNTAPLSGTSFPTGSLPNTSFQASGATLQGQAATSFQTGGLPSTSFQSTGLQNIQPSTTGPFQANLQQHTTGPFQASGLPSAPSTTSFQSALSSFPSAANTGLQPMNQFQATGFNAQTPTSFNTQPSGFGSQPFNTQAQPIQQHTTGPFQQATAFGQPVQQQPLQNQATGFGFGNGQPRANLNMASASNPFGL